MIEDGDALVRECFFQGLPPPPRLTASEWAEERYRTTKRGKFRLAWGPYQRGILDAMSDPDIETVSIMSAAQIGKTEMVIATILYFILQDPSEILCVLPTEGKAKDWSKEKLNKAISCNEELAKLFKQSGRRESDNTILTKEFPGGFIALTGAETPAGLASRASRIIFGDEIDKWPPSAGKEGDPMALAMARARTYWNRKFIWISTPSIKGASRIESSFLESDQRYFLLPCPKCEQFQKLEWSQVRWTELGLDPRQAVHVCKLCGEQMSSAKRTEIMREDKGIWQATAPFTNHAGFQLSSLYSPVVSFGDVAVKFLSEKKDRERLKVWTNVELGEPFEDYQSRGLVWQDLAARVEMYPPLTVPQGGLILTAGVDVQADRLAVVVRAWGRGEESWLVFYTELSGDTNNEDVWKQLDGILTSSFTHESGAELKIFRTSIDSSNNTHQVYRYVRKRASEGMGIIAIKGSSTLDKKIVNKPTFQDVDYQGRMVQNGVQLWIVGVETAKYTVSARLRMEEVGEGFYHFYRGTPQQYFEEICGEKVVTRYSGLVARQKWEKLPGKRNEAWDCEIYAYHAALSLEIDNPRWDWDALEKQIVSPEAEDSSEEIESEVDDDNESSWDRMSGSRAYRF
jgi:phage terminase large subunit GpA-like protein